MIDIFDFEDTRSLTFSEKYSLKPNATEEKKVTNINYEKKGKDSTRIYWYRDGGREKTIENENYVDAFSRDFESLLKCKLPILDRILFHYKEADFLEKVDFKRILIKAKTVAIQTATCQEEVLKILTYTCSDSLEHLEISNVKGEFNNWDISKLVELEHWKKAKKLDMIRNQAHPDIQNYAHFESANIYCEEVKVDIVKEMKEIFLHSPSTTKHLQISFRDFPDQLNIYELFGQHFPTGDHRIWFFKRPDNFVLFIKLSSFLSFDIKTLDDVPRDARVIG